MIQSLLLLVAIISTHVSLAQVVDKSTCTGPVGNVVTCNQPIKEFKCDEDDAPVCNGTVININNPTEDFYIKAEDDNIAIGTTFEVLFDTNISLIEGVIAGGDRSLKDTTVTITNRQTETLCIKKLDLGGDWSGDGFTLVLTDGPGSGGIKLEEVVCGDSGEACTVEGSGPGDTLQGTIPSCTITTVSESNTMVDYDCLAAYLNETIIRTARVPIPAPAARSNLEQEIEHDFEFGTNNDEDTETKITLSLSKSAIENLWGMVAVFLVLNIAMYVCYVAKRKNLFNAKQRIADEV